MTFCCDKQWLYKETCLRDKSYDDQNNNYGSITNKTVRGVVTVSRVRQMLDKSISAMFTTIEVYNKPTFEYREDTYSILAVNVWELLLNVRILQIDNNKISSIIDEVDKVLTQHYGFTDEELDFIPSASLRTGINYVIKYRMDKELDAED